MKYKIIIALIAILFGTLNLFSQNKISGNIKDQITHESLIGASIYVHDLKTGTSTDKDGNYQIANLKEGTYLLDVAYTGYKSILRQFILTKDTVINFELEFASKELTEVIITGVTRSTELKLSPIVAKSIDKNTLNQNSSTNLIDALKNIPGINQITTGASISKPIIRGLGYNRVLTLINGVRQEGQQWGDEHGIEIDEYAVDRVEIVKGPGSLLYGSDGIAGALNFIGPKAPALGKINTQLIANYQSNNQLVAYSLSNAGNKNGLQWLGRFSNKHAGNYQNSFDHKVYNSGFKETDGNLFLGINKNWGHSHLNLSSYNNTLNLIEGERDSRGNFIYLNSKGEEMIASSSDLNGYKIGFPHQEINHWNVTSNNYIILEKGTINADIGYQNNRRKEFGDPAHPDDKALYFDLSTINFNLRYNLDNINGWESTFGVSGQQQKNINKGIEFLIPAYNYFDIGAFVFTQKRFTKLTFASGVRFDNRHVNSKELLLDSLNHPAVLQDSTTKLKFSSFVKNYNGTSGSIGLSYQINKTSTLKFNLSRGFRAPNIAELASNGKHEGTLRYEIGSPNLNSEISHQIDLAYFLNSDHVSFELTPFINFIGNYIYTEKLNGVSGKDSIPDPNDPAPAFKFTQGNATLIGTEFYFDIHPHPLD
ncbi:MAG: TonB-dependent receptor, partial [Saprospiraceae bacterium]